MGAQHTPGPIAAVMFIHESGYVESYSADEIRAEPDLFRSIMAEHKAEDRKPLVMRAAIAKGKGGAA